MWHPERSAIVMNPAMDENQVSLHGRHVHYYHRESVSSRVSSVDDHGTPRTMTSESPGGRRDSQSTVRQVPDSFSAHEAAALRKHLRILEERLRNERHTHAVRFSEVEKGLIEENAKLKVANAALERKLRRDEHKMTELENELQEARRKADKKKTFTLSSTLSGLSRSQSDARLEDLEMKGTNLKRKRTDSDVIEVIKQRLSDSERDRVEAETQFSQQISNLLRERNIERANLRAAEETIMKLTGENSALLSAFQEFKDSNELASVSAPSQLVNSLKSENAQLRTELDQMASEKEKLIADLEELSEELTLSKANERQSSEDASLSKELKDKIDSLRRKMASMERTRTSTQIFSPEPGPSHDHLEKEVEDLRKLVKQKQRELIESHRNLVTVAEISQRYEQHCYNLEKELSKLYGKGYKYVEADWRKRDVSVLKKVKRNTSHVKEEPTPSTSKIPDDIPNGRKTQSMLTQTAPVNFISAADQEFFQNLLGRLNSMVFHLETYLGTENTKPHNAISEAVIHLGNLLEQLETFRSEEARKVSDKVLRLERTNRSLEQQNARLEQQVALLQQNQLEEIDDGIDPGAPITQAEINEKIMQARIEAANLSFNNKLDQNAVDNLTRMFLGESAHLLTTSQPAFNDVVFNSPWSSGSLSQGKRSESPEEDGLIYPRRDSLDILGDSFNLQSAHI